MNECIDTFIHKREKVKKVKQVNNFYMNVSFKGAVIWLIDTNCLNGRKRFAHHILWPDPNKMWPFHAFPVTDSVRGMSHVGVSVTDSRLTKQSISHDFWKSNKHLLCRTMTGLDRSNFAKQGQICVDSSLRDGEIAEECTGLLCSM